jgi:hypothetical protein
MHDVTADPVSAFVKSLTPTQHTQLLEQLSRPKDDDRPITQQDLTDLLTRHQEGNDGVIHELHIAGQKYEKLDSTTHEHGKRLDMEETQSAHFSRELDNYGRRLERFEDKLASYDRRIRSLEAGDSFQPAGTILATGLGLWLAVAIIKALTAPTIIEA